MFNNANVLFKTKFVDGVSTVTRYVQQMNSRTASSSSNASVAGQKGKKNASKRPRMDDPQPLASVNDWDWVSLPMRTLTASQIFECHARDNHWDVAPACNCIPVHSCKKILPICVHHERIDMLAFSLIFTSAALWILCFINFNLGHKFVCSSPKSNVLILIPSWSLCSMFWAHTILNSISSVNPLLHFVLCIYF